MHVDQEIVVWAVGEALEKLRGADLGVGVPVKLVEDEADLARRMPPARVPMGYFLHIDAVKTVSPAVTSVFAARPLTFPPLIIFGSDVEMMNRLIFNPNSRVRAELEHLVEDLGPVIHYWVKTNIPLQ